jgi:hypothetical protein
MWHYRVEMTAFQHELEARKVLAKCGKLKWLRALNFRSKRSLCLGEAARQQRTCSPLATPRQQLFGTCFQCSPSCWLAGHCSEHLRKSTIKYAIALISRKKMKNPSFTAYATNH